MTASHTNWSEVEQVAEALVRGALEQVSGGGPEVVVDFTGVRRVGPAALRELEQLAARAQQSSVRVVLRGVNVDVYKTLKLAALAEQFRFAT
jgi:anti-anti-sigma regulatory factor